MANKEIKMEIERLFKSVELLTRKKTVVAIGVHNTKRLKEVRIMYI